MIRFRAALLLPVLAACAAGEPRTPLAEMPREAYAPPPPRAEYRPGQLLVDCDVHLNAWQMAMAGPRDLEGAEKIFFTERALATLVHQHREELEREAISAAPRNRAIALAALAFSPEPGVLDLILNGVRDEDPMVAANALLAIGIHNDPATPLGPIREIVADPGAPDAVIRNAAYACLRLAKVQRNDPDPYLAGILIQLLGDEQVGVRSQAVAALGILRSAHAAGFLVERLEQDTEARVRTFAAWSLGEIGARETVKALAAALGDADGYVAGAARAALVKIHGEDRGARAEDWLAPATGS